MESTAQFLLTIGGIFLGWFEIIADMALLSIVISSTIFFEIIGPIFTR